MPKLDSNFTNILNKLITDKNITTAEYRITAITYKGDFFISAVLVTHIMLIMCANGS